jgi:hypothetical protein
MDHYLDDNELLEDYLNNTLFPSFKKGETILLLVYPSTK